MSRFSNLELGGESEDLSRQKPRTRLKDEAYYCFEARTAFENGNFEPALRLYGKIIEFNPNNAAAWTGQVRMLVELGEFREAKLWAEKALERFSSEPELLAAKAVALARTGDLEGAIAFSDASISERGDTPYVWLARGDVLLAREESLADYCFEKALMLASGDWFARWLAARIRFFYKQFALAMKLLQQAVELKADHFVLWLELGQCQRELGLLGPAKVSLSQAKQLNPRCQDAELTLIRLSHAGLLSQMRSWWREKFQR
jgi:tetratricopeptide (TPR) repeat protein